VGDNIISIEDEFEGDASSTGTLASVGSFFIEFVSIFFAASRFYEQIQLRNRYSRRACVGALL
jgi:hypothetical protein